MQASLASRLGAPFRAISRQSHGTSRGATNARSAAQRAVVGFMCLLMASGALPPALLAAQPAQNARSAATSPARAATVPAPAAPAHAVATPVHPAGASHVDARNDIATVAALVPTLIPVLANDLPGLASAARPLTITAVTQGARGRVTTDGTTVVYDPTVCSIGSDLFSYSITDGATTDTASVAVNIAVPASKPVTDDPAVRFVVGSAISSTIPFQLTWCGVPATGSSVKGYRVLQSTNAGSTFPKTLAAATTAKAITVPAAGNVNYAWQVRTTDSHNRLSTSRNSLVSRVTLVQDSNRAITYSSGWKIASGSGYSGAAEHYTTKAGATATMTVTNVRAVAIVASRATGRGSFRLYVDGAIAATVSDKSSSVAWKRILVTRALTSGASVSHQIQIQALGNGRIDLDAVVTLSGQRDPVLAFTSIAPANAHPGDTYTVSATATSGYPVQLSIPQAAWGVCSIVNHTVTLVSSGTCIVKAVSPGDATWNPVSAQQNIGVNHITQTITFGALGNRTYGGAGFGVSATTTSGLAAAFASLTPSVCTVASGTVSIVGAGTCTIKATQPGNGVYAAAAPVGRSFSVTPKTLTVSGITANDKAHDGTRSAVLNTGSAVLHGVVGSDDATLDASGAIGTFDTAVVGTGKTVIVSGLVVTGASAPNYSLVQPSTSADITIGGQTIHFTSAAPTNAVVGGPAYPPTAVATSGLTVAITVDPSASGVCQVSGDHVIFLAPGQCVLDANQAGDTNWDPAPQVQQTFTVAATGSSAQVVTFDSLPNATYGDGSFTVTASADSGLPITFSSLTGSVCTVSLDTVAIKGTGQCTVRAEQAGDATYAEAHTDRSFTVSPKHVTVTASSPANGTYGDAAPEITPAYVSWANTDGPSVLTTAPTCTTTYTPGAAPGAFATSCSGAAADNYTFSYVNGTFHVGTKALTVDFTVSSRPYSGGLVANITGCSLTGKVGSDDVTCDASGATAAFATAGAATGITVTGTGFALAGATATRYTIGTTHTTTADITKAGQTVAFTNAAPVSPLTGGTWDASATATSLLPAAISIDASSDPGVCSLDADGHTVHLVAAGSCVVDADQGGTTNYSAAPQAQRSFTVLPSSAHHLAFSVGPVSTTGGVTLADVKVEVRDIADGLVAGDTSLVTIAIGTNPSSGTLSGTLTVTAIGGVATFSDLSIGKTGTGYTLHATDGSLVAADSGAFNITVGPATHLVVTAPPTTTAGTPFGITVTAKDAGNNTATGYTGTIHLTSTDAGGPVLPADYTFDGGDSGSHTFAGGITLKTSGGRAVTATDTVSASVTGTSGTITVDASLAAKLAVGTQPSATASAGTAFAQQPVVRIEDAFGNLVTGDGTTQVSLALTSAGGATLSGTATKTASGGLASFTNLSIDKVGSYTLDASSSPALTGVTTSAVAVSAGTPDHLAFTVAPGGGTGGTAWGTQPSVQVQDAHGNPINGATDSITLAISLPNTPGGTLSCTGGLATAADGMTGTAAFAGCKIDTAGTYTLDATAPGLTGATSTAVVVGAASAHHYLVTSSSYSPVAGSDVTITAQLVDFFGNPVATPGLTVDWSIDGLDGSLASSSTLTNGSGIATVVYATSPVAGVGRHITATTAITIYGSTPEIDTVAGTVSKLLVTGFADPTTAGDLSAFTATAQDALGNTVTGYTGTLHFTSTDGAAALPADYSFQPADNGSHLFSGTLKTAGIRSITATDTVTGSVSGSQTGITVNAAASTSLAIETAADGSGAPVTTATVVAGATRTVYAVERDTFGNFTGNVPAVWSLADRTGGVADGDLIAGGTFKSATFTGALAGSATISAVDGSLTDTTGTFTVTVGLPDHLAFTATPAGSDYGSALTPLTVAIRDAGGNLVTTATDNVTLAMTAGPAGGAVSGTTTMAADGGIADFTDVWADAHGAGYELTATSGTLTAATTPAFSVAAVSASIVATANDRPYTGGFAAGAPASCSVLGAVRGNTLTCDLSSAVLTFASKDVDTGIAVTGAGFALDGVHKDDYTLVGQPSTTADITIVGSTVAVTVTGPGASYDGNPHGATASWASTGADGESGALTVTYTGRNLTTYGPTTTPPTNAGDYTASATFGGNGNHTANTKTADYSIALATSTTIVSCTAGPFTYTGLAQTPCSVTVSGANGLSLTPAPSYLNNTAAGEATASSIYAGDANHDASSDTTDFTIGKAPLTVTASTPAAGVYGDASPAVSPGYAGWVGGEGIGALSFAPTCSAAGYTAGDGPADYATSCAGGVAANYSFTYVAGNFHLGRRTITVTAQTDTREYDGTTASAVQPLLTSGSLATGDAADWSQAFDTMLAGSDKTLTPSGTVSHGLADVTANYAITFTDDTTGVISQRPITVTAVSATKAWSGDTTSSVVPTITSGSLAVGDTATWSQAFDDANVGTGKTLTPVGTVAHGVTNVTGSYALAFDTVATGVITGTVQTITFPPISDATYGDGDQPISATNDSGNDVVFSSATPLVCSAATGTNTAGTTDGAVTLVGAGTCTIHADAVAQGHYAAAATASQSFNVAAKDVTITVTVNDKPFNDTASATVKICTLNGVEIGDTVTCNLGSAIIAFASVHAADSVAVNASDIGITGLDAGKYHLTTIGANPAKINKVDPTCTITPYDVTYDTNEFTATGSCTAVSGGTLVGLDLSGTKHTTVGDYAADSWSFTDVTGDYNDMSGTVHDAVHADVASKYLVTSTSYSPTAGDPVTISAQLTDQFGNPVATQGKVVAWSGGGDGDFGDATSTTDSGGLATVTFTTGSAQGTEYMISATDDLYTGSSSKITTQ